MRIFGDCLATPDMHRSNRSWSFIRSVWSAACVSAYVIMNRTSSVVHNTRHSRFGTDRKGAISSLYDGMCKSPVCVTYATTDYTASGCSVASATISVQRSYTDNCVRSQSSTATSAARASIVSCACPPRQYDLGCLATGSSCYPRTFMRQVGTEITTRIGQPLERHVA